MNIDIEVEVRQERQHVWPVLVVGLYVLWLSGLLWWALTVIAATAVVWSIYRSMQAGRVRDAATAARADLQHQQVLAGDERGIYGDGYQDWRRYRDA